MTFLTRSILLTLTCIACAGCAAADVEFTDADPCTPASQECVGNAAYRVCNAAGDGWDVLPCGDGSTCLLGVCEALTDNDAGFSNTNASDAGISNRDTSNIGDSNAGTQDTSSEDTGAVLEDAALDTTPQDAGQDTTQPNDTSATPDTAAMPDTAVMPDTDPPNDTSAPPDVAPDDPCDPNPCTLAFRRTVCADDGVGGFTCACDSGTVEIDGVCVVPESCGANTCNLAGSCDDTGGVVTCMCDAGYIGVRCDRCDIAGGYRRGADGTCTNDLCDPDPCTNPQICQESGLCDPGNGQCSYDTSPLCAEATGNWRWDFTSSSGDYTTAIALNVNAATGEVDGTGIDRFGLSVITGRLDARSRSASLLKDYVAGSSDGSFIYTAGLDSTTRWSGSWAQDDDPNNNGPFVATTQSARGPSIAAGTWVFEADFADISVNLTVNDTGLVEGTMSDDVGASTVFGVFDRGDGALRLRKVYNETGADWWYTGTVNASGTVISGGAWSADSNGGQSGVWTGRRP